MPYVYRCRRCRASSPPDTRRTAEAYRQQHRDTEHGGLAPDGESIVRVPGSTPDPDGRYVSTGAMLGGLALLAVAEFVVRLWGR
ncbi:hypothetical protein [Streptomyces sp. NPDC001315]|uniref:hypothetical protein n=1 Tax=Streptomyces sp. NPDC001315 TaxID=3364562 RepID=UPI0036C3EA79